MWPFVGVPGSWNTSAGLPEQPTAEPLQEPREAAGMREHLWTQFSFPTILTGHSAQVNRCKSVQQRGCSCSANVRPWEWIWILYVPALNSWGHSGLSLIRCWCIDIWGCWTRCPVYTHSHTHYIWSSFDYMSAPGLCLIWERVWCGKSSSDLHIQPLPAC